MKIYSLKYEDTEQQTTIENEFMSKKDLVNKINECAKKGFTIIDVFQTNLYREL